MEKKEPMLEGEQRQWIETKPVAGRGGTEIRAKLYVEKADEQNGQAAVIKFVIEERAPQMGSGFASWRSIGQGEFFHGSSNSEADLGEDAWKSLQQEILTSIQQQGKEWAELGGI